MSDNKTHTRPIDPVLEEILPEFIEYWCKDLASTGADIVARENSEELYRYGHTIKGSFLQFGFRDLALAGKEIMAAAETLNWQDAAASINRLLDAVNALNSTINRGDEQ